MPAGGPPPGLVDAMLLKPALPQRLLEAVAQALAPAGRLPAPAPRPSLAEERPRRILLVEDNATNQLLMRALLARIGAEVTVAGNGAEAVEACRGQIFDVILMDLQMPVMDGLEATRAIRQGELNRDTRIVGLTAAVGPEFERQCREAGMNDYLSKPVQRDQLIQAIGLAPAPAAE